FGIGEVARVAQAAPVTRRAMVRVPHRAPPRIRDGAEQGITSDSNDSISFRSGSNMRDLASDYLEKYAPPKKRPKSVRDDRAMLDNNVLPKLGSQKVTAVGRREIEGLHAAMQDRPYQANRVLALLSKMFNLAVQWGWRGDNPVKGIRRYDEQRRHRWLQDDELQRLV